MSDLFTIVLVHGHGVDASIWNGIYAGLVSDAPVIKPDFSRTTSHATIEGYAEDLYSQLQLAKVRNVVLIGHSMGGYMALAFAERHPEMIRGLCLFHSTAYADDELKKEQRQQVINTLSLDGSKAFLETAITNMFAPDNRDRMDTVRQELINRFSLISKEALQSGIRAIMARPDRTDVLEAAQFPVLIIAGQHDQLIPLDKNRQLVNMAPNAEFVVLETSGHLGMIEQPDEALNALKSFVDRL